MFEAKSRKTIALERICTLLCFAVVSAAEYGARVFLLCSAAVIVSMLTEIICNEIRRKPLKLADLEASAVGLLVTLMMPPTVSYAVVIIACIFAIIIGRQIFGGSENPVFPAAAVGYVFAQLTWRTAVLTVPRVMEKLPLGTCADILTTESASHLWNVSGTITGQRMDWLTVTKLLPMGSNSMLLLVVVGAVLCLRRSSAFCTVLGMLSVSLLFGAATSYWTTAEGVLVCTAMTNLTLFSALYLFGDPLIAPKGPLGIAYGMLAGFFSFYLTRIMHIQNAPVMLSIVMQPLAIWMNAIRAQYGCRNSVPKEGRCAEQ